MSTIAIPRVWAVVYDESVDGNLSANGLAPMSASLSIGWNQILGSNGAGAPAVRDYMTFTLPVNTVLTSLTMMDTSPLGLKGFIGLEAGNQLTLPTNTVTAAGLLDWWH